MAQPPRRAPLASIAEFREPAWQGARYHKDLLPVTYVTADMAGQVDSPLYGMFALVSGLDAEPDSPAQYFIRQPPLAELGALKWDGEWQITYETFRDMGAAYSMGVFMIFVLLVVFIRQLLDEGVALDEAVMLAGAVRIKPIALTTISAMVGAYFIPSDPIFNGLAISLIFGLIVSTLLTILVVPLLYYVLARLDLMKKCFATAKAQTRFLG